MKKIILLGALMSMLSAKTCFLEKESVQGMKLEPFQRPHQISFYCVQGYKYIKNKRESPYIQMFKKGNGTAIPIKCECR